MAAGGGWVLEASTQCLTELWVVVFFSCLTQSVSYIKYCCNEIGSNPGSYTHVGSCLKQVVLSSGSNVSPGNGSSLFRAFPLAWLSARRFEPRCCFDNSVNASLRRLGVMCEGCVFAKNSNLLFSERRSPGGEYCLDSVLKAGSDLLWMSIRAPLGVLLSDCKVGKTKPSKGNY